MEAHGRLKVCIIRCPRWPCRLRCSYAEYHRSVGYSVLCTWGPELQVEYLRSGELYARA